MLNREGLVVNFCEWKGSERAMVCSVDDLREWSDFPKGLRVLLLGDDNHGAAEIKSTLEGMEYIVSTFYNENEALAAISSKAESFHVAIVEVSSDNSERSFMFLETVKDLPTIISASQMPFKLMLCNSGGDWHVQIIIGLPRELHSINLNGTIMGELILCSSTGNILLFVLNIVSNIHCLSTMMKCIALGAVEFLQKPISEDKLKNIWQHVVHKAFNAGESVLSKSLTPIKETVTSMLQLQLEAAHEKSRDQSETEIRALAYEPDNKPPLSNDRFPAPLTPQLEQGGRLLEDGDCLDQTNWSVDQETREHDSASMELRKWSCSDSKSVESTCEKSVCAVASLMENLPLKPKEAKVEEEVDSAVGSEFGESNAVKDATVSSSSQNEENLDSSSEDGKQKKGTVLTPNSCNTKDSKKKMKVDWTPELHRRFVQAVEQLGINQAIPSRILELMKVEGLTRHNVASHLQKYRMHRRHVMPKEDELAETRNWRQQRDPMHRGYNHRPVMAFPLYQSNCGLPTSQLYPVWGHPSSMQMWGHAGFPVWQPPESWHWNIHPGMHAEAWGCPVVQAPNLCSFYPQNPSACHGLDIGVDCSNEHWGRSSIDLFPAEEVVDKALKEAICKPWLPLPLGLKPPSTESVLTELQRRGITGIPPKT